MSFIEINNPSVLKRYTDEERKAHCEAWKASGLSMSEYAKQIGLATSSLSKWSHDLANKSLDSSDEKSIISSSSNPGVEIILASGIKVRVGRANLAEILRLIKALNSCS
jgi:transposase-like protein